jgi:hypothetical protein
MPETIKCVHCEAPLRMPEQFIGQEVRCPSCQKTFTARMPSEAPPPPRSRPEPEPRDEESAARSRPREIDEDDAPSGRRRPRPDDDDEDYPRTRRPRYDDDRSRRSYHLADRGGVILALGVISLATAPIGCCFGPLSLVGMGLGVTAIFLGRNDLAEIRTGQRDPTGQGMTNAGMICGVIGTIVSALFMFCESLTGRFRATCKTINPEVPSTSVPILSLAFPSPARFAMLSQRRTPSREGIFSPRGELQ